jgi:hypothetical protein
MSKQTIQLLPVSDGKSLNLILSGDVIQIGTTRYRLSGPADVTRLHIFCQDAIERINRTAIDYDADISDPSIDPNCYIIR